MFLVLYKSELEEIAEAARREVHKELAHIEEQVAHEAGSYTFLCAVAGDTIFTHSPVGRVIRYIPHQP